MKYTQAQIVKEILKAMQNSGKKKSEYAAAIGVSRAQLSQFIHNQIDYVPTKILENLDLKRVDTVITHYEDR